MHRLSSRELLLKGGSSENALRDSNLNSLISINQFVLKSENDSSHQNSVLGNNVEYPEVEMAQETPNKFYSNSNYNTESNFRVP